jgi:hypothetical protein
MEHFEFGQDHCVTLLGGPPLTVDTQATDVFAMNMLRLAGNRFRPTCFEEAKYRTRRSPEGKP